MQYYALEIDWDPSNNSPWDELWYSGDLNDLNSLGGSHQLKAIWRPPAVTLQERQQTPDIYSFIKHFAVNDRARALLEPHIGRDAEFLPLDLADLASVSVIHPLWPIDFDDHAEVQRNSASGNITVVRKYSFTIDPARWAGPRRLFRMLQAPGSAARAGGSTLSTLIVSQNVVELCRDHSLAGVRFTPVHCTEDA